MSTVSCHSKDNNNDALMKRMAHGDESAFNELWRKHKNGVLAYISMLLNTYLGDDSEAEDVIQEVFFKVWQWREKYLPESEKDAKFITWLFRIARNESLNRIRIIERIRRLPGEIPTFLEDRDGPSPPDIAEDEEMREKIWSIPKDILNEKEYRVFVLKFKQKKTVQEISKQLSIPEGTVKSIIRRIKEKLSRGYKDFRDLYGI